MKKLLTSIIISIVTISILTSSAFAISQDLTFKSMRQRGMGGAGVAVANDLDALFLNPACLSQIKGVKLRLFEERVEINQTLIDKRNSFSGLNTSDQQSVINVLKTLTPAQFEGNNGGSILGFGVKNFGVGAFHNESLNLALLRKTNPYLKINALADAGALMGLSGGISAFGAEMNWGTTLKYIGRARSYDSATASTTIQWGLADITSRINDKNFKMGYYMVKGFGADVGLLTGVTTMIGSGKVGLTVKNIGASLSGDIYNESNVVIGHASEQVPIIATLGLGVTSDFPPIPLLGTLLSGMTVATDIDVISPESSFFKRIHMGIEKNILGDVIKLRGGLNQGYLVGGIGADLMMFHLNYVYNVESFGTEVGLDEQRCHIVQIGFYL